MKPYTVALTNAGERLPADFDLGFLAKKLNALQKTFLFAVVDAIPSERFGKPDLGGQWYFFKRLFGIVQKHPDFQLFDYFIGITHVRVTEDKDSEDDGNRDWFSFSDLNKTSIITLNHNITIYNPPSKDIYQFIAFSVAGELLCNVGKKYFYHDEVSYCLFDECIDRGNVKPAIESASICPVCHHALKTNGLSDTILEDINRILVWCRGTTGKRSPLYRAVINPFTALVMGAALGWAATTFVKSDQYPYVLISTAAVPTVLFFFFHKKSKMVVNKT